MWSVVAAKKNLKYLQVEIKNENIKFCSMLRSLPRCWALLAINLTYSNCPRGLYRFTASDFYNVHTQLFVRSVAEVQTAEQIESLDVRGFPSSWFFFIHDKYKHWIFGRIFSAPLGRKVWLGRSHRALEMGGWRQGLVLLMTFCLLWGKRMNCLGPHLPVHRWAGTP